MGNYYQSQTNIHVGQLAFLAVAGGGSISSSAPGAATFQIVRVQGLWFPSAGDTWTLDKNGNVFAGDSAGVGITSPQLINFEPLMVIGDSDTVTLTSGGMASVQVYLNGYWWAPHM